MSFEFPTETYIFPMGNLLEAVATPTMSGEPGITAEFDADFPKTFAPFTARIAGQKGILRICGEEVSLILVQTEIPTRSVMLPLDMPEDADRLVRVLNARSCDPPPGS